MGFISNSRAWLAKERRVMDRIEEVMTGVILTRATMLAPHDNGALQGNGRVEKNPNGGKSVVFGGPSVPYARRRHFENELNPQTLHYLQRAGDSVKKENLKKYVDLSR